MIDIDTCPPSQGPKFDDFEAKMKIAPTRARNVMTSKKNTKSSPGVAPKFIFMIYLMYWI